MTYPKDVLVSSLERRMRHVMVRLLDEFDKRFDDTSVGHLYKIDIKNAINDLIRANNDELNDYDIVYRPVRLRNDNVLSCTKTFMESVEKLTFSKEPLWLKIQTVPAKLNILESIRTEFKTGICYLDDKQNAIFATAGLEDCIKMLPFLDRYNLVASVGKNYADWRDHLVHLYIGARL